MRFRSFEEFWPFYMNQHTKASTRRWHFYGCLGALVLFLVAFILKWWWLLIFAPAFAHGIACYSHIFIEGNSPRTSHHGYPLWSLICDFRLFFLMLSGRLDRELKRLGKRPILYVS